MEGTKKKSTSFQEYSWNSEVEATWISLIGWHNKTSTIYVLFMAIYLGVSLPQVHYQDWNVKTFLYQSTLVLPGMPQLAVLKLLLSFISNGSGK